ncbi:hypothetical protein [Streptomyces olivoreticuli]|uniref:hypothetical protein n=1 Tax=Streptomyces olivoreticuli TaxID=68246 RepID=UPI000E23E0D8|nr:hypothetical protein [Streptomyces olivoreticuli]
MGWTVLYIAFGVVALWLLGEVLLQYKARLRWRLLAFVGFLGVVVGVVLSSVPVIAVGAIAFAVGQTYVTLSFRRGFSAGWAIRRDKGGADAGGKSAGEEKGRSGRRRRTERSAGRKADPLPEPAPETAMFPQITEHDAPDLLPNAAHQPAPYGDGYDDTAYLPPVAAPYDAYGNQAAPPQDGQFDYGQGQYAAYSDPYIGSRPQPQEQYDAYGQPQYGPYPQQQYGVGAYSADAYAPQPPQPQYDMDTPPGGVWVPQQRDTDAPPPQQYPSQGQGPGHDEQHYRY